MYLSKISLRPDAGDIRPFWRLIRNSYDVHTLIWDIFGDDPERKRDFLFRTQYEERLPSFLVLSSRQPENRYDVWNIQSRRYEPVLSIGQKLSFILRANPVRARTDENGRMKRHDVVMDAKKRLETEKKPFSDRPDEAEIVQKAGFVWLATRGEAHGFSIEEGMVRADGYLQHRLKKPKGGCEVRFSTIEFSGLLTVEDPERFLSMLYQGIGPSKGFGCGLMLIKPVYA